MPLLSVNQLLEAGAAHHDSDVEVIGWVVAVPEHWAIHDSKDATDYRRRGEGIWITGALPQPRSPRDFSPLHGAQVKLCGKFHWQPRSGAGHFRGFRAWIGVKAYEVLQTRAEPAASPNGP